MRIGLLHREIPPCAEPTCGPVDCGPTRGLERPRLAGDEDKKSGTDVKSDDNGSAKEPPEHHEDAAVSTEHSVRINGQQVPYTATAGTQPVWDEV